MVQFLDGESGGDDGGGGVAAGVATAEQPRPNRRIREDLGAAHEAGPVGGDVYGIGGGSVLGPILVGRGMPLAAVAPAALASTFATSVVGAGTYALLAVTTSGDIAPNWAIGLLCGLGGVAGGYLGARLQPRLPDTGLRLLLGVLAITVAILYAVQTLG